jgi:hypothetical protein
LWWNWTANSNGKKYSLVLTKDPATHKECTKNTNLTASIIIRNNMIKSYSTIIPTIDWVLGFEKPTANLSVQELQWNKKSWLLKYSIQLRGGYARLKNKIKVLPMIVPSPHFKTFAKGL